MRALGSNSEGPFSLSPPSVRLSLSGKKYGLGGLFGRKIPTTACLSPKQPPPRWPPKQTRNPAMKAWKIVAGISCCSILATGCSMCQHPSFDCGPVWSQGTCLISNPDYRAGSILNRSGARALRGRKAPGPKDPRRVSQNRAVWRGRGPMDRSLKVARGPWPNRRPRNAHLPKAGQFRRRRRARWRWSAVAGPSTVRADAAPAETTEGDARILPEKPSEDLNGWRPVATRQAPDLGTP